MQAFVALLEEKIDLGALELAAHSIGFTQASCIMLPWSHVMQICCEALDTGSPHVHAGVQTNPAAVRKRVGTRQQFLLTRPRQALRMVRPAARRMTRTVMTMMRTRTRMEKRGQRVTKAAWTR